jgi:hypothetical protein
MNIHYECLDAQDDFHAQMKKNAISLPTWLSNETMLKDLDQSIADDYMEGDHSQISIRYASSILINPVRDLTLTLLGLG